MSLPLKAHLHILQLEGYSTSRFLRWWITHPLTLTTGTKKPLVYTQKVKQLILLSVLLYLFLLTFLFSLYPFSALLAAFLLFLFPFPLLFLSLLLIRPYELLNRFLTIRRCRRRILSQPELTVIGITGSFGKTSTKDFLYQILDRHAFTLKTPLSYNTTFGISKVIDLELTPRHRFLLCEMGAYRRGEIKSLCYQVPPQYAVLTAIGSQHLERFGHIGNTTLAKFELIDAVPPDHALVNLDNPYIEKHLKKKSYRRVLTYSLSNPKADFYLSSYRFSPQGVDFTLVHHRHRYTFNSPLFGTSNLQNLTAAVSLSLLLDIPEAVIKDALASLTPAPHRLELKIIAKATIIDNTYSSNYEGLSALIADLSRLPGRKAIITPGMIELGRDSAVRHRDIGRAVAPVFATVVLAGDSDRTRSLATGITGANPKADIRHIYTHREYWPTVDALARNHDWILLENDLPDNY